MIQSVAVKNEKPRNLADTKSQGMQQLSVTEILLHRSS